jgi:Glycosyltransferases involved in cell wall biogenesis
MAKVTVVIPFLNRQTLLVKALRSVFRQTYKDWKVVLVDDGSKERYSQRLKRYLRDPRVKLIRNRKNLGQSRSLNAALAVVDTPYMIQLDSDDMFFPNTLELLVKAADKLPKNVAVISGNVLVVWENEKGKVIRKKLKKGRSFSKRYEFLLANRNIVPRFYRTSALRKVGGWPIKDPYKGRYREDMLMLYRLIGRYRFHWIDKSLYIQRVHRSNLTLKRKELHRTVEWSVRNALKRWGGQYRPVFTVTKDGWKKVKKLIPKWKKK